MVVSDHDGAVEWLSSIGVFGKWFRHFDPAEVIEGDLVFGSLPPHLIASINRRGGRFFQIAMDVPPELRHVALSREQMERIGARLVEVTCEESTVFEVPVPGPRRQERTWGASLLASLLGPYRDVALLIAFVLVSSVAANALGNMMSVLPSLLVKPGDWESRSADFFVNFMLLLAFLGASLLVGRAVLETVRNLSIPSSELKRVDPSDFKMPKRVAILPLSNLVWGRSWGDDPATQAGRWEILRGLASSGITSLGAYANEIEHAPSELRSAMECNIVQAFRALRPHEHIEAIYLVPSCQSIGTVTAFLDLASRLPLPRGKGRRPEIHVVSRNKIEVIPYPGEAATFSEIDRDRGREDPKCVGFDDYDAMMSAFRRAVDHARDRRGVDHDGICIDVTSGQKTVSIAAAIITINRDLVISYVDADRVTFHDARLDARSFLDRLA